MTFAEFLAAFVRDRLPTEELPAAALQAMEEGYDSNDLAALAGQASGAFPSDLEILWRRGLRHLAVVLPGRAKAGRTLRDYYAGLVASGSIPPREGAAALWRLNIDLEDVLPRGVYVGAALGVARLIGLYFEHDEVPDGDEKAHRQLDDAIREECRRIVGG